MKNKEITATIIRAENEILVLSEEKKRYMDELADIKDLMRKMREQEVKIKESTYCFNNGVGLKKQPKEIYPLLERKVRQVSSLRAEVDKKLTVELKVLIDLMRSNKLVGGELDMRVSNVLKEY